MNKPLKVEDLCKKINSKELHVLESMETAPLPAIIGQNRAVKALEFGLGNKAHGFNVYVSGMPVMEKLNAVKDFLDKLASEEDVPNDWCYVNNFKDPYQPRKLSMPAGTATDFNEDIGLFIHDAQRELLKCFESEDYTKKREGIMSRGDNEKQKIYKELNEYARKQGLTIQQSAVGLYAVPEKEDGETMTDEDFRKLKDSKRKEIIKKQEDFSKQLKSEIRRTREIDRETVKKINKLDQEVALYAIEALLEELREKYESNESVLDYLASLKSDMLNSIDEFTNPGGSDMSELVMGIQKKSHNFSKYEVNVVVDNENTKGAPIVVELNPTYNNLFGKVEQVSRFGTLYTDFTLIRKGALHEANGGYIVIPAVELLTNLFAWDSLKRALRNKEIVIENVSERLGFVSTKSLKPDPIPLNVQVILIGTSYIYHLLYHFDKDFKELFKVKADFSDEMQRNKPNTENFAALVNHICAEGNLLSIDQSAFGKLVEYSSRLVEHKEKMTTHFNEIADILHEADYYARNDGVKEISENQIIKAIDEKYYRSNFVQERINNLIKENTILIDLKGKKVGQINGLSVLDLGDISFGKPNKITCSVQVGKKGILDIEREVELGGPIHSKGVMILSGYLTERFAQDFPPAISAQLVFEQSYSEIEGDSASSAELYTLLSSLSKLPIQQGVAVTGSVNQKGEIQPIGGVNDKIEGFFEICSLTGLNGEQGVIIPESNIQNLMLKEKVLEAVQEAKFRIWAVKTVDEGIEILTGTKAGKMDKNGNYEKGSVNYLVLNRFREMTEKMREYSD